MAIITAAPRGLPTYQINGATDGRAPIFYGQSGYIASAGLTAGSSIALPVDANGNTYPAYILIATGAIWFCFTNGTGAATVGGANCWLQAANGAGLFVRVPVGATNISAIYETGVTTGSLCVIGVY
jgi:hypothetical protein